MAKQPIFSVRSFCTLLLLIFFAINDRISLAQVANNSTHVQVLSKDLAILKIAESCLLFEQEGIYRVDLPIKKLEELNSNGISYQLLNRKVHTALDSAQVSANIHQVHQGMLPLSSAYLGDNVIVGIIDLGIDFNHPDFTRADGSTKIRFIWDQADNTFPILSPQPYSYGREWNWLEIENGVCTHVENDYSIDENWISHGTAVTSVAASNGRAAGNRKGAAPESEIIAVSIDFNEPLESAFIDAVDFIFKKADALGKACVINSSLGIYEGAHDARDLSSQFIESLLQEREGRAMVNAAGNAGQAYMHLGYELSSDTSFSWFEYNSATNAVQFEIWIDSLDLDSIFIGFMADDSNFNQRARTDFRSLLQDFGHLERGELVEISQNVFEEFTFIAQLNLSLRNELGRYNLGIEILPTPSVTSYRWRFRTIGTGRIDCWSNKAYLNTADILYQQLPPVVLLPEMIYYQYPDNQMSTFSSWACSDKVLTVGSYQNLDNYLSYDSTLVSTGLETGRIDSNSSNGPTRDGRIKPDLCAAGTGIISAGNLDFIAGYLNAADSNRVAYEENHVYDGGTSLAAPVVSGAVALYFEQYPNATATEVVQVFQQSAYQDQFTGPAIGNVYGYGKLDAFAAQQFISVLGCTDNAALNYNPVANVNDGSCLYPVFGCTDSLAENYNPDATDSDSSCTYINLIKGIDQLVSIYPNPAIDVINVEISKSNQIFELFDLNGQAVLVVGLRIGSNPLSIQHLEKGVYFARLSGEQQHLIKIIKQ